jgi:glycosyltransferase 2 family protein
VNEVPADSPPRQRRRPGTAALSAIGTDRFIRAAAILIPLGILGNVILTLVATDRELLASVSRLPVMALAPALTLALIPWFTGAARLLIWTRFLGFGIRWRDALRASLATDLGAAVSPTAVGGDVFRWGVLVRRGVTPGAAATVTLMPKLEDAVFFAVALPFALVYTGAWRLGVFRSLRAVITSNLIPLLIVGMLIALASWAALRFVYAGGLGRRARRGGLRLTALLRRRLRGSWRDSKRAFQLVARGGRLLFCFTLLLTAVHWISRYSVVTAFAWFLGVPVDPVLFWLMQWVVFTVMTFIPTPGAAGGAEAAFSLLYAPLLPAGALGITTAGWRFLTFYLQAALAALFFGIGSVLARRQPTRRAAA